MLAVKGLVHSEGRFLPWEVASRHRVTSVVRFTRLQIFFFLVSAGREVPAGQIQAALEVPGPTLSHRLDILRRAGLIRSRKEERYVDNSVSREMVSDLVRFLLLAVRQGGGCGGPKEHQDKGHGKIWASGPAPLRQARGAIGEGLRR